MTSFSIDTVRHWRGYTLLDRDGEKVGTVEQFYVDTSTDSPEWLLVHTGLLGTKRTFVPLAEARQDGEEVWVPYDKAQIKDAPSVEPDRELTHEEEAALYRHYGREDESFQPGGGTGFQGRQGSDDAMTRSEEELQVGTQTHERGRARLRKWIETEPVRTTVRVEREEPRLEREPITDDNIDQAMSGPDLAEREHEVILHEQEPVVEKRVVPQERVRLETETVAEEREVDEELRKERVDIDHDKPAR